MIMNLCAKNRRVGLSGQRPAAFAACILRPIAELVDRMSSPAPKNRPVRTGTNRPSRENSRAALLDATSELMREMDTVEVGIVEIAQRAGVNHAMIRYFFGSKEGLFFALLDRDVERRISQLDRLFRLDVTPTERMRIHLRGIVDTYYQIPYLNRLIQVMVREADPERVRHIGEELLQPIANAQARIIEAGVAAAEFRPIDPKLFYFNTIGAADGLYSNRFTLSAVFGGLPSADPALHARYREQTVETLMRGLLR